MHYTINKETIKKALSQETSFQSVRGPESFSDGDWQYTYQQKGDIKEYDGYEEMKYKGELVFFSPHYWWSCEE